MKKIIIMLLIAFASVVLVNAFELNTMTAKDINKVIEEAAITIPEPARTPEITLSNRSNAEQQLNKIAAILKGKGVIQMPPVAIENFANELNVKVELVYCHGETGLRKLTEIKIKEVLNFWKEMDNPNATSLTGLAADEVQVLYLAEVNGENNNINNYLINSLVRKQDRARVKAILNDPDFGADFIRLQTYDVGAEIVGREVILIKPWDAQKALVIELDYVQS